MCKLLAADDSAIPDPLDPRCLAACGSPSEATALCLLRVCRGRVGKRGPRTHTSHPRRKQPWLGHRQAKAAKVFAEASNSGFKLRDPAQQDGGAEIGAHARILGKYRK